MLFDEFMAANQPQKFNTKILNRCNSDPKSTSKNFEGSEKEMLFKILNQNDEFSLLQNLEEFQKLKNRLIT